MAASDLYLGLAAATVISMLVSLSSELRIRLIRVVTVLGSYVILVKLFSVAPLWQIATVWGSAGLVAGFTCFAADWSWARQGRQFNPDIPWPTHWWLIPLGLIGWPDMLPQALEFAMHDLRTYHRHLKQARTRET